MVKDWMFPPEIKNKVRMTALTTCIQYVAEGSTLCNEREGEGNIQIGILKKSICRWHDCLYRESYGSHKKATRAN